MHFSKKLPEQHMHVQYHFTFGVTDRLSDLMQFSKLRVNHSYGPLPSNLCPIKQEDNDPKYYKNFSESEIWNAVYKNEHKPIHPSI